jgi:hypothetical protein
MPGGHALTDSLAQEPDDAAQWWQAYCLAENDEAEELRLRSDRGDDHARRQLACWLGDRGRAQEAVEVIRPLADAGEDIARLWLARWLAECGQAGELRERADAGDAHALDELAGWLAGHDRFDELRELVTAREGRAGVVRPAGHHGDVSVTRVLADAGDGDAQRRLAARLARRGDVDELRQRANRGDEYAREQLARSPQG